MKSDYELLRESVRERSEEVFGELVFALFGIWLIRRGCGKRMGMRIWRRTSRSSRERSSRRDEDFSAVRGAASPLQLPPFRQERFDPEKGIVAGPIGMFKHGGGASG